jgi:ATP-dependent helicase/nuclease subunit A
LAVVLKSPLVGWDEQTLFTLAQGRGRKFLWQVLRAATDQHGHLIAMLNDLLLQADFLRPYELLERVLTHYAGRKLLLGRLGQEAEDGLNALLGQAMAYERSEVPSLTGFLVWMQSDGLEIKRQADQDGNQIRVMTVHGAKGLESPIVILPDTAKRDARLHDDLLVAQDGAFWKVPRAEMPPRLRELRERKLRAEEEERDRLLYVAITRAEKWLIVAAAGDLGADQRAWYQKISLGVEALAAQSQRFPTGMGRRFDYGVWGPCSAEVEEEQSVPSLVLEEFFNEVAPPVPAQPKPLSPSDLGGEKSLQSDAEETDEDAKLRGLQIHKLLEVLPSLDPALWPDMCSKILDQAGLPASAETFEALKAEVLGVLKTPDLQFLFGFDALAEVALSGPVAGLENKQVYGIVDRLVVQEAAVWLVDFKSNAQVPESPAEVPLGLLRQMAAYAAVIARTYPDHQIIPALLWTKQARLMPLPDALLANVFSEPSLDL